MLVAAAALAGVAYGVWYVLDDALGRALIAQVISVGVALVAGTAAYIAAVLALRITEARQIVQLIGSRIGRNRT